MFLKPAASTTTIYIYIDTLHDFAISEGGGNLSAASREQGQWHIFLPGYVSTLFEGKCD